MWPYHAKAKPEGLGRLPDLPCLPSDTHHAAHIPHCLPNRRPPHAFKQEMQAGPGSSGPRAKEALRLSREATAAGVAMPTTGDTMLSPGRGQPMSHRASAKELCEKIKGMVSRAVCVGRCQGGGCMCGLA